VTVGVRGERKECLMGFVEVGFLIFLGEGGGGGSPWTSRRGIQKKGEKLEGCTLSFTLGKDQK